jgi:hypothetical protein
MCLRYCTLCKAIDWVQSFEPREPAAYPKTAVVNEHNRASRDNTHETMPVKIRLARFGRVNEPFYNIVVAHAR